MNLREISKSLNSFKFPEVVPSFGEDGKIELYPYTVKDQFTIAQAQMTQDSEMLLKSLFDILRIRTNLSESKLNDITLIDYQWLLMRLRMYSDDPVVKIQITCSECSTNSKFDLNINEIEIKNYENFKRTLKINDSLSIGVKIPSFIDTKDLLLNKIEDEMKQMEQSLISSIDFIAYGDEVKTDFDDAELLEFLQSLRSSFMTEFEKFKLEKPYLYYDTPFVCSNCSHTEHINVENFFFLLI